MVPEGSYLSNFRALDVKGDGLQDLLYLNTLGPSTIWNLKVDRGTLLDSAPIPQFPVTAADKVMVVDYDADGRDDIVRVDAAGSNAYWVHRSNGAGLASGGWWFGSVGAFTATAFAADISGDGFPEIVRVSGSTWHTHKAFNLLTDVVTCLWRIPISRRSRQLKEPSATRLPAMLREIERLVGSVCRFFHWRHATQ